MLVLEDPSSAAASLDRFLRPAGISEGGSDAGGQPMELGRFLRLAINLAAGLGKLHRRGLMHKDIKPAHILVDLETNKVWFTGFGISSRLARERQAAEPPEVIAGTLAYMAPEQTGRMNRSIDSRSDLYSLGVTFYQMLTGVSTLYCVRSDGVGALPCGETAGAAGREAAGGAGRYLGGRHEAARQDRGGALPDRRRSRGRSATRLGRMGEPRANRRLPSGRARYA